MSTEVAAERSG